MKWQSVEYTLPGSASTSDHSVYSSLAQPMRIIILDQRELSKKIPESKNPVILDGLWDRWVDHKNQSTEFFLPPSDAEWAPSFVPANYGKEPTLRYQYGPVWYRRKIRRPKSRFFDLRFEAVDYLSDVVINHQNNKQLFLGRHEGYYCPFYFDLSSVNDDTFDLLVRVQDPLEELDLSQNMFFQRKNWIKGVLNYHDSRFGCIPGSIQPGWTPKLGQSPPTGGIIGQTSLILTGEVRVDAIFITPLSTSGDIHLAIVMSNRTKNNLRAEINIQISLVDLQVDNSLLSVKLPPGSSRLDIEGKISNPILWKDASYNEQIANNLYKITVNALVNGTLSHQKKEEFGIRTTEIGGDPWKIRINGQEEFIRAANYIPIQHWANVPIEFYERDLRLLLNAHLFSIGIHGHIQSEGCYKIADRMGVLIFQDFPLQWGYASGEYENPGFIDKAKRMISEMAYLLWNHPSVVYWACHNEPLHAMKHILADYKESCLQSDPRRLLDFGPDKDLGNWYLDQAITDQLKQIDPMRFIKVASGNESDIHIYPGTLGGSVYDVGNEKAPFVSEYGAFPVDGGAISAGWEKSWPPNIDDQKIWWQRNLMPMTIATVGGMKAYPNLPSFIYATQRYASFFAKYCTEYFRFNRGKPYSGYRWHFFVNWWGYAGGGLVDVDRQLTDIYQAISLASRPRLALTNLPHTLFNPGIIKFPIRAVNDTPEIWNVVVHWKVEALEACEVIRCSQYRDNLFTINDETVILPLPYIKNTIDEGDLSGEVNSNSVQDLGLVSLSLSGNPAAYRLYLSWGFDEEQESNQYTVLVASTDWHVDYGYQIVDSVFSDCQCEG